MFSAPQDGRLLTLSQFASSHVIPRTEMVLVLTSMDPGGQVDEGHLHSTGCFLLI